MTRGSYEDDAASGRASSPGRASSWRASIGDKLVRRAR